MQISLRSLYRPTTVREIPRRVWAYWRQVGGWMGDAIARILLTLAYFSVFLPFGLGVAIFGDHLDTRRDRPAQWRERPAQEPSLDHARRLF